MLYRYLSISLPCAIVANMAAQVNFVLEGKDVVCPISIFVLSILTRRKSIISRPDCTADTHH
jgi:hypothetical protein